MARSAALVAREKRMAAIGRLPSVQARAAAFRRAERVEQAAWLKSGKRPQAYTRHASALYKALGRRYRTTKNARPLSQAEFKRWVGLKQAAARRARHSNAQRARGAWSHRGSSGGGMQGQLQQAAARIARVGGVAGRRRNPKAKKGAAGLAAARARRHRNALQAASRRRLKARPLFQRSHGAVSKALHRARQVARTPATRRRLELAAAIKRLERAGVVTARSSPAQQRTGTISAGPRAVRLRALQRALERRTAVNPRRRKGPKNMAKLSRNRKGQFLPRGRRKATRARRRRRSVAVANPRKRHHRRRRAPARVVRHHRRRRVRNPSFSGVIGTVKSSIMPMGLGGVAGATAGFMDAKFLGSRPLISILAKLSLALAGAALMGRRHPLAAAGWAGGMVGATGYYAGVKLGGGLVALSPQAALKGIADMAADDPEMATLIAGLGDVVDDSSGELGDVADDYNATLGDVVDEDMGDVVEAYGG